MANEWRALAGVTHRRASCVAQAQAVAWRSSCPSRQPRVSVAGPREWTRNLRSEAVRDVVQP
eukprot:4969035-Prymnesium_polylepis.2